MNKRSTIISLITEIHLGFDWIKHSLIYGGHCAVTCDQWMDWSVILLAYSHCTLHINTEVGGKFRSKITGKQNIIYSQNRCDKWALNMFNEYSKSRVELDGIFPAIPFDGIEASFTFIENLSIKWFNFEGVPRKPNIL